MLYYFTDFLYLFIHLFIYIYDFFFFFYFLKIIDDIKSLWTIKKKLAFIQK